MIEAGFFGTDPWSLTEPEIRPDLMAQMESIFALSNGHIGLRGNLDEGEPHAIPGTYLNGFFETIPLPYAEAGYGYPEEGQTLINVTNGKLFRILVDDEPFDIRYGDVRHHTRKLDFRTGTLERSVEWYSPSGQGIRIRTTRMVSFVQRAICGMCLEVEPIGDPARIVVQSSLVANEPVPQQAGDPRAAAALRAPLVSVIHRHNGKQVTLGHHTRSSGLRMAAGLDHVCECESETDIIAESEPDLGRVTFSTQLNPGQTLRIVKLLAYGWSSERSMPALRDQVDAALAAARRTGWQGMLDEQRAYLDSVWARADIELGGDVAAQQAVRFAGFQLIQSAARAEQRAIPAKGLTGRGYDGHTFWDMESYILPVISYISPRVTRDILLWRYSTLDMARARAKELRLKGAVFPWRTIHGEECSGYWPAGTAALHINADIADAVRRYLQISGDEEFARGPGLEMLVETARLWRSVGHHDAEGLFRIDGVTGPDEYSALVDNNVFTNLMAARNLRVAADLASEHPEQARALEVDHAEIAAWRKAAESMLIPFDEELGITAQSEGFTRYRRWDFRNTEPEEYPLLLSFPYYLLYSSQVVKQADLVMALFTCGESFDLEQKRRDFSYYESVTVRDSSLSASIQSIVATEVGHLDLAYRYFRETALVDLYDVAGNAGDGLHLASLAGACLAVICGFGGMRDHSSTLRFAPRLPDALTHVCFRLTYQQRHIKITIEHNTARYELISGEPMEIIHHGVTVQLSTDAPQTRTWADPPNLPDPPSPYGRAVGDIGIAAQQSTEGQQPAKQI
ncbi:MAG TPA: glycosyl hydrolase family 65 protein [Thermomicrobiales bacterium]|nr:glycosyl hydrolase family 65 protein [Thermomicrobiales bacterium]